MFYQFFLWLHFVGTLDPRKPLCAREQIIQNMADLIPTASGAVHDVAREAANKKYRDITIKHRMLENQVKKGIF